MARIFPRFTASRFLPGSSSKIGWALRRPFSYGGRYGPCGVGNLRTRSASVQFSAICGRHWREYRENLGKSWAIRGNLGEIREIPPRSPYRTVEEPGETVKVRRFDAPPDAPYYCCGCFLPSKSIDINDMPLNLHFPYSVTTYPSRSMSGVIAITLYGVPLTFSPSASPFSTP